MIFEHEGHNAALDAQYIASLDAQGLILPITYTQATWPIPRRACKVLALIVSRVVGLAPLAF